VSGALPSGIAVAGVVAFAKSALDDAVSGGAVAGEAAAVSDTGGGVAATAAAGVAAGSGSRAVNAASPSSMVAPDPNGAALAPVWPVGRMRAAELVWSPSMITRGDAGAGRAWASARAKQPMRQVARPRPPAQSLESYNYLPSLGGDGRTTEGHFCRPRGLATQFVPTSRAFGRGPPF
jgi:hypothetical protein